MSLWSKIVHRLEITLPDHYPEDPYNVDQVFKGAKWVLKGTDTSTTKTSNGTSGIPSPSPIANAPAAPSPTPKRETLELTTTTAIVSTLERLEALLTNGNAQPQQQFANSTCHFCSEIGHTMNAEGKIILPSVAMIPNYFGKQLYMERIKEWHRLNPGQIVTGRLSSNANLDPKQAAMQQLLIHEVMQQDVVMGRVLSKEEQIKALERELFALRQPATSSSSLTSAPAAKPVDKGKASEHTVINEQLPITKEPITQPPIHPFSGIPSCYIPPANRNFAAPDQTNNVFEWTNPALAYLYTMASNISDLSLPPRSYLVSADTSNPLILGQTLPLDTPVTDITPTYVNIPFPAQFVANEPPKQRGVQIKKKYKPVAMKTKPVASHVSEDF
ncbi:hypothetical protein E4T56_gene20881 [Termitomyces sp. T112]|nr:hypothetical protein E4T56_gene20881 [Termitomyces sp. T112]